MADFRRSLALVGLALALGVGTASAQNASCTGTTGAPPILRSQGIEELTGQIVLNCSNLTPTNINVNLLLASPVTSRAGEPFIIVAPTPTSTLGVIFTGVVSGNTVIFNGVNIPGPSAQITIGGVRSNVSAIPTAGAGSFTSLSAQLAISNGSLPLQQNLFVVGFVQNGLNVTVTTGALTVSPCSIVPTSVAPPSGAATIAITEGFATAFKVQNPSTTLVNSGASPDSETGPYPNGTLPNSTVLALPATSGTQLAVAFANVPSGFSFYVPTTITSNFGGIAVLVTTEGGTTPVVGAAVSGIVESVYQVTAASTVFYNVISAYPSATETYSFPAYPSGSLVATAGTGPSVTVALAPRTSTTTATDVPLFINSGANAGGNLLPTTTIAACQTSLLFPFLTNQAGFDTGMSIAYTAKDPFGTGVTTTAPSCFLNLYGANGPTAAPALTVPVGGEGHTTISAVAPNFQGYGIAVCNFQFAHGYAFITDGFMGPGKGLSEGYTANVLTYATRPGGGFVSGTSGATFPTSSTGITSITGTPETLGH